MVGLENVSTDELRDVLAAVDGKRPTQRLMAAINYLEEDGATMEEIAHRYGYTSGWLSRWVTRLDRLDSEPVEAVVYDDPRAGRPSALSEHEHQQVIDVLHHPPAEVGFDAPAWSVPLARNYLAEAFGVEYSHRHVRRLLREAGLSPRTARPAFYRSDDRAEDAWPAGVKKSATIWTTTPESSP
jgi:transposase